VLLAAGADPAHHAPDGTSAMDIATEWGSGAVMDFLRTSVDGKKALQSIAAAKKKPEVQQMIRAAEEKRKQQISIEVGKFRASMGPPTRGRRQEESKREADICSPEGS
jgi:hypothetical protein